MRSPSKIDIRFRNFCRSRGLSTGHIANRLRVMFMERVLEWEAWETLLRQFRTRQEARRHYMATGFKGKATDTAAAGPVTPPGITTPPPLAPLAPLTPAPAGTLDMSNLLGGAPSSPPPAMPAQALLGPGDGPQIAALLQPGTEAEAVAQMEQRLRAAQGQSNGSGAVDTAKVLEAIKAVGAEVAALKAELNRVEAEVKEGQIALHKQVNDAYEALGRAIAQVSQNIGRGTTPAPPPSAPMGPATSPPTQKPAWVHPQATRAHIESIIHSANQIAGNIHVVPAHQNANAQVAASVSQQLQQVGVQDAGHFLLYFGIANPVTGLVGPVEPAVLQGRAEALRQVYPA